MTCQVISGEWEGNIMRPKIDRGYTEKHLHTRRGKATYRIPYAYEAKLDMLQTHQWTASTLKHFVPCQVLEYLPLYKMIGKSADIKFQYKFFVCNGQRLRTSRPSLFWYPFYITTADVPGHMQMEISASQNKDTLKITPKFCKDKKIPTE